jgi:hypothetical protein
LAPRLNESVGPLSLTGGVFDLARLHRRLSADLLRIRSPSLIRTAAACRRRAVVNRAAVPASRPDSVHPLRMPGLGRDNDALAPFREFPSGLRRRRKRSGGMAPGGRPATTLDLIRQYRSYRPTKPVAFRP